MSQTETPSSLPALSAQELSALLLKARRNYTAFPAFPAQQPTNFSDAYDVQDISRANWDDVAIGWKVGGVPAAFQDQYKAKRITGPIFQGNQKDVATGDHVQMPVCPKGFAAVEGEIILKLKDTSHLPASELTEAQVISAVESAYVGVEVASSLLYDIHGTEPVAAICDFGNNWGLLIGPQIKDWQNTDLTAITVSVDIDGGSVGMGHTKKGLNGPLGAAKFLIEHHKQRGFDMPAGTYISSGAISGVHRMEIGSRARISFAGFGYIDVSFITPSRT